MQGKTLVATACVEVHEVSPASIKVVNTAEEPWRDKERAAARI